MRTPSKLVMLVIVVLLGSYFGAVQQPKRTSSRVKQTVINSQQTRPETPELSLIGNHISTESESTARRSDENQEVKEPDRDKSPSDAKTIVLKITGLTKMQSDLHIALFSSAAGFPKVDRSTTSVAIPVNDTTATHQFSLENIGSVSIAVFQDLDGNGILSKNDYGIPTEPYGFSKNARGFMGSPSFKQAEIMIKNDNETCEILLK